MESPPEDPQREAVYAMERAEFGCHARHVLPIKVLRKFARGLARQFDVKVPRVLVKRHRGYGALYDPNNLTIYLDPQFGKNALTLAHELAHHIVAVKHPRATDHGPAWMRVYGVLLDMMRLVPQSGLQHAARRHGVRMAAPIAIPTRPSVSTP